MDAADRDTDIVHDGSLKPPTADEADPVRARQPGPPDVKAPDERAGGRADQQSGNGQGRPAFTGGELRPDPDGEGDLEDDVAERRKRLPGPEPREVAVDEQMLFGGLIRRKG